MTGHVGAVASAVAGGDMLHDNAFIHACLGLNKPVHCGNVHVASTERVPYSTVCGTMKSRTYWQAISWR